MSEKTYILLSIPEDFLDKFTGFIHNVNMINNDEKPPIKIERIGKIKKKSDGYAAVPNGENGS